MMGHSSQHITIQLLPSETERGRQTVEDTQHHMSLPVSSHNQVLQNAGHSHFSDQLPVLAPIMNPQYLITLRSTYRATSITLAQTAFFGAGLTYANLFNYLKPQPALLAWSASTFVVGAVGAGTMSFFGQFDSIWNERGQSHTTAYLASQEPMETTGEWLVGAYGWISCSLVLLGLAFLNLSMVVSAFNLDGDQPISSNFNKGAIVTAGLFSIFGSMALVIGALYVRYRVNSPIMRASNKAADNIYRIQAQPTPEQLPTSPLSKPKST